MSIMLKTVNPEAAENYTPRPLPGIATWVNYHLREMRAGVRDVPAAVLAVDHDNRRLKLLVIFDHQDMMTYESVPERVGDDQGWEWTQDSAAYQIAELTDRLEKAEGRLQDFMNEMSEVMWGDHPRGELSVEARLLTLEVGEDKTKARRKVKSGAG